MSARGLRDAALAAAALAVIGWPLLARQGRATAPSEAAYRANNLGVARLEQYDFAGAETSFRRALALTPSLATARLNLVRIRRLGLPQPGRLADAHAEHGGIVDEIEARRPRRAAKAMTDHIRYAEIYLKRLEKENPDFFV